MGVDSSLGLVPSSSYASRGSCWRLPASLLKQSTFLGSCLAQSGKKFLRLKFLDNSSEILGVLSAGRRVVNSPAVTAELAQVKEK